MCVCFFKIKKNKEEKIYIIKGEKRKAVGKWKYWLWLKPNKFLKESLTVLTSRPSWLIQVILGKGELPDAEQGTEAPVELLKLSFPGGVKVKTGPRPVLLREADREGRPFGRILVGCWWWINIPPPPPPPEEEVDKGGLVIEKPWTKSPSVNGKRKKDWNHVGGRIQVDT